MKTKPLSKYLASTLAVIAAAVLSNTARADLTFTNSATVATWNTVNGQAPFYTTSLSGLSAQGAAGANAGATNESLSETFTITNGAGSLVVGETNYVLNGIAFITSAGSAPIKVHIYDVTTALTSNNGSTLNGSGASYTLTNTGDLLGAGGGLSYSNNLTGTTQVYLALSNGTNTYDQIVLGSNHTYALEFSFPVGGSFIWSRGSTADPGGQGMGSKDATLSVQRLTLASLGLAGGAPRTFAIALYGTPTSAAPTVNNNTNAAGIISYIVDDFSVNGVTNSNPTNYDWYIADTNALNYSQGFITNVWGNWFGDASTVCAWDGTMDAQNNTNTSGSLKITMTFGSGSQLEVWNQGTVNNFFAMNINGFIYSNFEADVLFAGNSPVVTNTNATPPLVSYGFLQFGLREPSYGQDYFGNGIQIPAGTSNWTHVVVPLNPSANANEADLAGGLLIHIYGPFFTGSPLLGNMTMWVDNIRFTGSAAITPPPPPKMAFQKAVPDLRIFAGSLANTYDREELNTVDQSQSWIGGSGTVTYSFTLDSTANFPGFQTHVFLLPVNSAPTGNGFMNNEYIDYQCSNSVWLQINGSTGGAVTANVSWKTNLPNSNPNNVAINITNSTGVGTWTLEFDSATTGKLTAPGAAPVAFTINDPTAATDFANPLVAFFGIQANSTQGGGAHVDYNNITIAGVAGVNVNDTFANDAGAINAGIWNINNSAAPASLVCVAPGTPFWITWTAPANGYGLAAAPSLLNSPSEPNPGTPFALPGYYSDYLNGNQPPNSAQQGANFWTLMTTDFLPTVNYVNNGTGTVSPTGFFELVNPPLAN